MQVRYQAQIREEGFNAGESADSLDINSVYVLLPLLHCIIYAGTLTQKMGFTE